MIDTLKQVAHLFQRQFFIALLFFPNHMNRTNALSGHGTKYYIREHKNSVSLYGESDFIWAPKESTVLVLLGWLGCGCPDHVP